MKRLDSSIAPWLKGKSAYLSPHIDRAWEHQDLARMMSNEFPLPPAESVREAIEKYGAIGNRYPDAGAIVRSYIAELNRLDGPEYVLLGNGSNETLEMAIRTFVTPGDEVIQQPPCYFLYALRSEAAGGKMVSVPILLKDGGLIYDYEAVLKAITPRTKIIIFGNPNNPTGNYAGGARFMEIVETGIPVIVDEAYVEFAGLESSHVGLVKKYPNVIIDADALEGVWAGRDALRLLAEPPGYDASDVGAAPALERRNDRHVGGIGGAAGPGGPARARGVYGSRTGQLRQGMVEDPGHEGLSLPVELHALRCRRHGEDRQGDRGRSGQAGHDYPVA